MRLDRKQNAQSLVEFALIIPLLIFMITLFIDVGRAIFTYSELANSVREGTRYAIVHPLETPQEIDDIESIVLHYSPTLNPDEMMIKHKRHPRIRMGSQYPQLTYSSQSHPD